MLNHAVSSVGEIPDSLTDQHSESTAQHGSGQSSTSSDSGQDTKATEDDHGGSGAASNSAANRPGDRDTTNDGDRSASDVRHRGTDSHDQLGGLLNDDVIAPLNQTVRSVGQNKPVTKIVGGVNNTTTRVLDSTADRLPNPVGRTVHHVTKPVHETTKHTLDPVTKTVDHTLPTATDPVTDTVGSVGDTVEHTAPVPVPKPVGGVVDGVTDTVGKAGGDAGKTVPGKPIEHPILGPGHHAGGGSGTEPGHHGGSDPAVDPSGHHDGKPGVTPGEHKSNEPSNDSVGVSHPGGSAHSHHTGQSAAQSSPSSSLTETGTAAPSKSKGSSGDHQTSSGVHHKTVSEHSGINPPAATSNTAQPSARQPEAMPARSGKSAHTAPHRATPAPSTTGKSLLRALPPAAGTTPSGARADSKTPSPSSHAPDGTAESTADAATPGKIPHRSSNGPDVLVSSGSGSVSSPNFNGSQHPATTDSPNILDLGVVVGPAKGPNQAPIPSVERPDISPD